MSNKKQEFLDLIRTTITDIDYYRSKIIDLIDSTLIECEKMNKEDYYNKLDDVMDVTYNLTDIYCNEIVDLGVKIAEVKNFISDNEDEIKVEISNHVDMNSSLEKDKELM